MKDSNIKTDIYLQQFKEDFIALIKKFKDDTGQQIDHVWLMSGNKQCVVDVNEEVFQEVQEDGKEEETDIQPGEVGSESGGEKADGWPEHYVP